MNEPNAELIKEVYALFGTAYYHSECLHRELGLAYDLATFEKPLYVTLPRCHEKLAYAFSLTLGQVLGELQDFLPGELYERLEYGVKRRNYLAHHFWWERAPLMLSDSGLERVREELSELATLFHQLDEDVSGFFKARKEEFGLTDELMQEALAKELAGEPMEPLPTQRFPKKWERVVRAWDVPVSDGVTTLVFETEDRCLWQFCDVGLGWSYFNYHDSDWRVNQLVQDFLPATVNPRPALRASWDYDFTLASSTTLWVKPREGQSTFRWGLKAG